MKEKSLDHKKEDNKWKTNDILIPSQQARTEIVAKKEITHEDVFDLSKLMSIKERREEIMLFFKTNFDAKLKFEAAYEKEIEEISKNPFGKKSWKNALILQSYWVLFLEIDPVELDNIVPIFGKKTTTILRYWQQKEGRRINEAWRDIDKKIFEKLKTLEDNVDQNPVVSSSEPLPATVAVPPITVEKPPVVWWSTPPASPVKDGSVAQMQDATAILASKDAKIVSSKDAQIVSSEPTFAETIWDFLSSLWSGNKEAPTVVVESNSHIPVPTENLQPNPVEAVPSVPAKKAEEKPVVNAPDVIPENWVKNQVVEVVPAEENPVVVEAVPATPVLSTKGESATPKDLFAKKAPVEPKIISGNLFDKWREKPQVKPVEAAPAKKAEEKSAVKAPDVIPENLVENPVITVPSISGNLFEKWREKPQVKPVEVVPAKKAEEKPAALVPQVSSENLFTVPEPTISVEYIKLWEWGNWDKLGTLDRKNPEWASKKIIKDLQENKISTEDLIDFLIKKDKLKYLPKSIDIMIKKLWWDKMIPNFETNNDETVKTKWKYILEIIKNWRSNNQIVWGNTITNDFRLSNGKLCVDIEKTLIEIIKNI